MMKYTFYVLDDEPDAVSRMLYLLKKYDNLRMVGTETSPQKAISQIKSNRPDILFIDIEMPGHNGFDVLSKIRDDTYSPITVFVTAYNKYAIDAIKKAAFDYLLKPVDRTELDDFILRLPNRKTERIDSLPKNYETLTIRETEVFEYLRRGCSSRDLAIALNISVNTVDTHRRRILKKLNYSSTTEIVLNHPPSSA